MGYANTCPDCNCEFEPGHSCPPRPIGDRVRALEAENARLQRSLELSQHDHEVAVEAQRELATKSVELVDEIARLQEQLKTARACDSDALMVSERDALQARVEEAEGKGVCSSSVHCLCRYSAATQVEIAENQRDRYKALAEKAERQLLDQVAGDLGEYLEVVGRGVQVWNYMDMMLLPRMEGLAESLQASYEHTAQLEALAERWKEALNKGRWLVALLKRPTGIVTADLVDGRSGCGECDRWLDTEDHEESCHYAAAIAWLKSSRAAIEEGGK